VHEVSFSSKLPLAAPTPAPAQKQVAEESKTAPETPTDLKLDNDSDLKAALFTMMAQIAELNKTVNDLLVQNRILAE